MLQDVLDVAPSQLVPQALKTVKGKRAAARSLVGEYADHECAAIQEHENEPAEVVIVCEPEGTSLMMGGLHPRCCQSACLPLLRFTSKPCRSLNATQQMNAGKFVAERSFTKAP
jgi:hypothetical protein